MAHGLRLGVGMLVFAGAVGCWSTDKPPSTFGPGTKLPDPKLMTPASGPTAKPAAPVGRTPTAGTPATTAGAADRFGRPAGTTPPPVDSGSGMGSSLPGLTTPPPASTLPNNAANFRDPPAVARPIMPSDGGNPIVSPPTVPPLPFPEPPPAPALPTPVSVMPPAVKAPAPIAPSTLIPQVTLPEPSGGGK